jgi:uncharacterized protein
MKRFITTLILGILILIPHRIASNRPLRWADLPLEQLIQVATKSINQYWATRLPKMGKKYRPPTRINKYTPNAPIMTGCGASIPNNAFYCTRDHSISYDYKLFERCYKTVGDCSVVTILAHEWGHLIQNHLYPPSNGLYTIQLELQADALAGAYTKYAMSQGILEKGDLEEAVQSIYNFGDDTPWFEPGAHGTPKERAQHFLKGVKEGIKGCFQ